MDRLSRRKFIATSAAAITGWAATGRARGGATSTKIAVVYGTDIQRMFAEGMRMMGGMGRFVKAGQKVTIKPNAAFARRPEHAATTNPAVVTACVSTCITAGAGSVVASEHPVTDADKAFRTNGILAAVQSASGKMIACDKEDQFRQVTLPRARSLTTAEVAVDVLDTGCLINMPVVKSHSSTGLTCSMKNWMGSIWSRRPWHLWNLEQKIADLSTFIRPTLIVADATRVMTDGGPRGPGTVVAKNQLIFGTDPVAVDAYCAGLVEKKPTEIEHIVLAGELGVGTPDLKRVEIVRIRT